jgi:DNA-directed RNA polymerase specialized sigma24 family protein
MNPGTEEIRIATVESDELMHYGMPRRSGRYPYGSGEDPYQHGRDFLGRIEELKKSGWTETPENIKAEFGITTTQYRTQKSLAKNERRLLDVARAKSLKKDGLGATEIGRIMNIPESSVRSLLNEQSEARTNQARKVADFLKKTIDEKGMIEVGAGVELEPNINVSKEKFKEALAIIEAEGYPVYGGRVEQATNKGKKTTITVACPPGTEHKDIFGFDKGELNIHSVNEYITRDGGETFEKKFHYPESMDSKRLQIRYAEEGGIEKDGVVELRRGVADLSLGESRYSQVRIMVDGTHYIKGMAVYGDDKDFPPGVDVIFNTNKKQGTPTTKVLKEIKPDPDNPFGSLIKDAEKGGQYWYDSKTGKTWDPANPVGEKKLGLINKRADEGDWSEWKDTVPSQFLSKQSLALAKKQINLSIADKQAEFDELMSLTNPTVKKNMLQSFADDCDATAGHLKAAALPGQKYHVIIPMPSLKDTEVYAPNYDNGTKLALVRYPHGGTFEIPILTVNNKHALSKKLFGSDIEDAVCINSKVAERLSGADFDGDTVMCIPTHDKAGKVKITSTRPLKKLEGFDPKAEYPEREGMRYMTKKGTQLEMGKISNLITDMTLQGANEDELAAAVRHSMVVIDAHKHKLDYKKSELDNNISSLVKEYQRTVNPDGTIKYGGASTLISRAKSQTSVDKRQGSAKINIKGKSWYDPSRPEGALIYNKADDLEYTVTKVNKKTGEVTTEIRTRKQQSTKMAETDDARTLISESNTKMEHLYADYANTMKDMANKARLAMVNTGKIAYSATAKETYRAEVESLNRKLKNSLSNAPRERIAQITAKAEVEKKKKDNPDMDAGEIKKASQQALSRARQSVNAKRTPISITDREWEAIQAGAISENVLKSILDNTDKDNLRERATPRTHNTLSQSQISRIKTKAASGYSTAEIARQMGISASAVSKYLKGGN